MKGLVFIHNTCQWHDSLSNISLFIHCPEWVKTKTNTVMMYSGYQGCGKEKWFLNCNKMQNNGLWSTKGSNILIKVLCEENGDASWQEAGDKILKKKPPSWISSAHMCIWNFHKQIFSFPRHCKVLLNIFVSRLEHGASLREEWQHFLLCSDIVRINGTFQHIMLGICRRWQVALLVLHSCMKIQWLPLPFKGRLGLNSVMRRCSCHFSVQINKQCRIRVNKWIHKVMLCT